MGTFLRHSVELRRLHLDLIFCYKMVFGLIKLNFSDCFEFSSQPTRGHAYKLYKVRSSNARVNFFACRIVNVWNSLPDSIGFTSLAVFKSSIRTIDFSEFLKCNDV